MREKSQPKACPAEDHCLDWSVVGSRTMLVGSYRHSRIRSQAQQIAAKLYAAAFCVKKSPISFTKTLFHPTPKIALVGNCILWFDALLTAGSAVGTDAGDSSGIPPLATRRNYCISRGTTWYRFIIWGWGTLYFRYLPTSVAPSFWMNFSIAYIE